MSDDMREETDVLCFVMQGEERGRTGERDGRVRFVSVRVRVLAACFDFWQGRKEGGRAGGGLGSGRKSVDKRIKTTHGSRKREAGLSAC